MPRISDPEVRILAVCSETLHADYQERDASWRGSPFAWIKTRPSRQAGSIGEKLVAGYLATKGFDVVRSPDSEADRVIAGKRVEIKMSTLWENGSYVFQQLRDQNYELVICLGISPFDAHCWVIPKSAILERWKSGDISSQHGGRKGSDTAWLNVVPASVSGWLQEWGGTLSQATEIISRITGQRPL